MPLPLVCGYAVNLLELSKASGVPRKLLDKIAHEYGCVVINDYAFTEKELNEIKNEVSKIKETTLAKLVERLGYDESTMISILIKLGFRITWKTIYPSDVLVSTAGHE